MSREKKKEIPMWAQTGHARPVTRREFLGAGIIPFSASMLMPNWTSLLLPKSAQAAQCAVASSDLMPFITLNLAGGAGLSGNFVPHDQGNQMLSSYNLMGLGKAPIIEREFGNVPFAGGGVSKFLQGIRETAPKAIAKTAFVGVCVRSRDDSSENKFAADGMVAKAGLMGTLLPNLGRRANSPVGIGQQAAVLNPPAPLIVNNFTALTSSLGYAGALGASLNQSQKESLANLIARLSEKQSRKLAAVQSGDEVKSLIDCAGIKNEGLLVQGSGSVDPRLDPQVGSQINTVWNINGGTGAGTQDLIFASMAYNAIKGQCGSVALEVGGYDYHNNTRTTGDDKDLDAGRNVGKILETAQILNKKVFIYVTSDGATSSAKSDEPGAPWTSDRGSAGMAFMLCFNPAGRPATNGFQVGNYTAGQAANEDTPVGGSPEAAAAAVFANYLALNNRLDLFSSIAGRALDAKVLEQVLKFV